MAIVSFVGFLLFFLAVGMWSASRAKGTMEDYLLAGRSIPPLLTSLSAAATNNSGFMFIGMIGAVYAGGLKWMWLQWGFIFGDYLASLRIYRRVREVSERRRVFSYAALISRWHGEERREIRILASLLTVVFLGVYAAAQFKAGGKALEVLFGWHESAGAVLGACIISLYCWAGGLRASIWTDTAQSVIMIGSMGFLLFSAIDHMGGAAAFLSMLYEVSPDYMEILPYDTGIGLGVFLSPLLFVAGFAFGGLGVSGQPHIMARFMSMRSAAEMPRIRLYYYSWNILFAAFAIACGLAARVLLPESDSFDPELALPNLSIALLPEIFAGLMLAGLFAATMSTADSQLLSCSAAISRDLLPSRRRLDIRRDRISILFMAAAALWIALAARDNVFTIVLLSWAGLASAFTPVLLVYVFGGRPPRFIVLLMMLTGLAAMLAWRELGLQDAIYEAMPGILAALLLYGAWLLLTAPKILLRRKGDPA